MSKLLVVIGITGKQVRILQHDISDPTRFAKTP